jgi:hypothetical protein
MSSLPTQTGVPAKCTACDASIPTGRDRCPSCGKVYGEWNRCPSCHAIAAVHEARRGMYVCAACSAPRKRQLGTPVDSQFADELMRRAWFSRASGWALWPLGAAFMVSAALVAGFGQLFDSASIYASAFGGFLGVLGVVAMFVARRLGKRGVALRDQARQERVLTHVLHKRAGLTAGETAQALHIRAAEADAALTILAKEGKLNLDVDDRGTVRYRVLTEEELRRRGLESEAEDERALLEQQTKR